MKIAHSLSNANPEQACMNAMDFVPSTLKASSFVAPWAKWISRMYFLWNPYQGWIAAFLIESLAAILKHVMSSESIFIFFTKWQSYVSNRPLLYML